MTNQETLSAIDEKLLDLRKKLNKESIQSNFRPKLIGGLNEKDVIKYIDIIEEKYEHIEQEMKKNMYELVSSRDKLQKELENCNTEVMEEKKALQESLEQSQNELQQMTAIRTELEQQLTDSRAEIEQVKEYSARLEQQNQDFKTKVTDLETELKKWGNEKQNYDDEIYLGKIRALEDTLAANMAEIELERKLREQAEEENKLEKARVSNCKINGFKDEVFNIYQQLELLTEEQVQMNKELQEKLMAEQLRANKAENSLEELRKWVSDIKDKLYSEQNLFEIQFRKMAERYSLFQSELNQSFITLEEQESQIFTHASLETGKELIGSK